MNVYHSHVHGLSCGHRAIRHDGHVDYIHDGRLHHHDGDEVAECSIAVTEQNPEGCTPGHDCDAHPRDHVHGAGCGHELVPHGDHLDYLVGGHLHHPHGPHCDDHGALDID